MELILIAHEASSPIFPIHSHTDVSQLSLEHISGANCSDSTRLIVVCCAFVRPEMRATAKLRSMCLVLVNMIEMLVSVEPALERHMNDNIVECFCSSVRLVLAMIVVG